MRARLLLATGNPGKQRELAALLTGTDLQLTTPAELGLDLDPDETGATFLENAVLKARAFARASGLPALADDSGLEVDALGGEPGIHSARWVPGSDADRVTALLERLRGVLPAGRTARFRCVVALARPDGTVRTAEGRVEGRIAAAPRGEGGFGYDPVFLVEDGPYTGDVTLAELPAPAKNALSHRARALAGLRHELGDLAAGA